MAAGVSYYMMSSALAALAEERALWREEAEPRSGKHGKHGKHASFTAPNAVATPAKHKHHERASEQARRAVASAAELASRVGSDGERDEREDDDDQDAADDQEQDDAAPAGVLSNLEYAQRVLADDAMPSRAAQRFTHALGQTPETPHDGGSYGVYGDADDVSAEEEGLDLDVSEAASGLETGLETEEERSGALRRRRRADAAAASGRLLSGKVGFASEDGAFSSDAPLPLMPPLRHSLLSPKRAAGASEMPEVAAWNLGGSSASLPPPANALSSLPPLSRTTSGVSALSAPTSFARPSSGFRVRGPRA